ncbi:hypothetical protein BKA82DRAFT_4336213 [Pisolithus tinctorius]|nr:hypothetical protein BKA82DRAFT_4336213 [Pisolithus tinctorius]
MYYSEDSLTVKFLVAAIWSCLITNYGIPMSLNYSVWFAYLSISKLLHADECGRSLPMVLLVNVFVVSVVQCLLSPDEVVGDCPNLLVHVMLSIGSSVRGPAPIHSSGSSFPRTKHLLKTLIIYTVNWCLLTLLFTIAELVTSVDYQDYWALGLDFIIGKLYANSLLVSLNSWEHLWSQAAGTLSDLRVSAVHFTNPPRLPQDIESSKDRAKWCNIPKMAVIDITTNPALNKTTVL